jgi:hypothetical protein
MAADFKGRNPFEEFQKNLRKSVEYADKNPKAPPLKHLLFNLARLFRAVGAWRVFGSDLGLHSPGSLRPRLAYAGPLALKKHASN